jgi:ABC-2 type transport system permease protein
MFKGFFRDRVAVFFTFLFPLMFLVVFGLIFNDGGASKLPIGVVGDGPIIQALPADAVEVQRFDSLEAGIEKVRSGDLPAVIAEQGDDVVLRFAASDRTGAGTALGLINGVVSEANVAASGGPPRFSLQAEQWRMLR